MEADRMFYQPRARTRRAALGLLAFAGIASVTMAGCDPRTLFYFFGDGAAQIPGQAPSLEDKKIVIVTTAASSASTAFSSVDKDITRELSMIFREKLKKIEIVDAVKVNDWLQAHPTWTDPGDIAKAFDADYVLVFEVASFSIEDPAKSPGMLEGNCQIHIRVTENAYPKNAKGKPNKSAPKEINQVFEDEHQTIFPKNTPIPLDSGTSRTGFKSKFTKLVAGELSWYFLGHNPSDEIGRDERFN